MNPLDNPFSKESTMARSPGGNRKSKQAKAENTKGQNFEREVKAELQKSSSKSVRINNQRREGGGLSNPDITPMHGWSCEVKNTKKLEIPEWLRNLKKETPPSNKPMLVFSFEDEPWLTVKLAHRMNFAADSIENAGGEVSFYC